MKKLVALLGLCCLMPYNANAMEIRPIVKASVGFDMGSTEATAISSTVGASRRVRISSDESVTNVKLAAGVLIADHVELTAAYLMRSDFDVSADKFSIDTWSLDLNYRFAAVNKITPYVGVGVNFDSVEYKSLGNKLISDDSVNFGLRVGGIMAMTDKLGLDLSFQYNLQQDYDKTERIGNVTTKYEVEFSDYMLNLGLVYKF